MKAITHLKNIISNVLTSNNGSSSNQPEKHSTFDILSKNSMNSSIHEKFALNFEGIKNIEALRTCKVLKFTPNISFEDILSKISKLDSQQLGHLFIFAIEVEELSKLKIIDLQKCLQKFSETRLIILQIKINEENVTKIYFKRENSNFQEVEQSSRNDQSFKDFPRFLQLFLTSKVTNFEGLMLEKLPILKDSQQIIRFLGTLKLSKEFYKQLILKCAADGSKNDLLAAIDAPFEEDGRMLSCEAENLIKYTITVKKGSNSRQNNQKSDQSVLLTAVTSQNVEVLDYLISYCGYLIQQLPFEHQIQVSTAAYAAKQFDVLCDFLNLCDFPFPKDFKPDPTENQRFNQIIKERKEFFEAVDSEELNLHELSKFINKNKNLNIIYNFYNDSTLFHALASGHYEAYFHLKSLGFEAVEFDDISEVLEGDELKKANKIGNKQRVINVENSSFDNKNPIDLLATRSKIHNRKTRSDDESEYRKMIRKWYEDIFKSRWGCHLLRVASVCQKLRIIFDFESDSVENVSLQSKYTQGSMYPQSKWIFIGAKLSGINREQQIKGVIAHELCHYVMKLVYDNNEEPYFKHDEERQRIFKEIVEALDKWSKSRAKDPDDECEEIISGVYRFYTKNNWIAELIVRIPQILAHFDNNSEKISALEVLYERLFQYYGRYVVPDMTTLDLEEREKIRNLNKNFGILTKISCLNYEFQIPIDINAMYSNILVVLTNVPMFLYSELYKSVQDEYGNLADAYNIFISNDKLNVDENLKNFSEIIVKTTKLNVIVDCTGQDDIDLKKLELSKVNKILFICTNEEQYEKVKNSLNERNLNPSLTSMYYNWHGLSQKSQKAFLQTEIKFQNSKQKFFDILWNEKAKPSAEDTRKICDYFSEISDDKLLNLMAENKEISIQTNLIHEIIDADFQIIFQDRNFIKKIKFKNSVEIPQKALILSTKKDLFVLISDIAGTGKSWAMKMITKMLREQIPTKWITYIDLNQFIKDLEAQKKKELNFLNFMIEKVFDFKRSFESKMFKELYKKGQVCILFDGFDEISPNYAEIVKKLIESFKQNGGNQLWIATRDFFEVDLQKHLKLDVSYKLVDFRDEDGIDLIVRNCVLTDLRSNKIEVKVDFDNQVKSHPKYQIYLEAAIKLHQKISNWSLKSIGLPQLYKMIGDVLIEFQDSTDELTEFTLYDKFIDHLYKRWYSEKGKLREQKCIDNQKEDMNYRELHEFCAMKSLFPENSSFCDLELDKDDWNDEEIVGGGILNKKTEDEDEFLFPHETYREFFAASFIIRILKKKPRKIDLDVLKYLIKFCSNPKYGVIQMFLWQGFKDIKALPSNKMMIVSTNVSKLLQINIYQHIQKENKNAKNIFVIPDDPHSNKLCEDFGDDFIQNSNLKVMVKSQKDFGYQLEKLEEKNSVTIIIIVPDEERGNQHGLILQQFKFNPLLMHLKYNWNDLNNESQYLLLQDDINIHNHTKVTLCELLTGMNVKNEDLSFVKESTDISKVANDEILNIIANKSQIEINKILKYDMESKAFQLLFEPRSFIKKVRDEDLVDEQTEHEPPNTSNYTTLSQDQLISDVKDKHYVLISDVAGTGKSFAAQDVANTLRQKYPRKWVTYVHLSFLHHEFIYCPTPSDFFTFCIKNLLKIESQFKLNDCFMNLYNSGNVIFFFDGYDEVAHKNVFPDLRNFSQIMLNSLKSFKYNGGNQLWIVTKDHFEDELIKELKIDTVYKMDDFGYDNGARLMAKYQIISEMKAKNNSELEKKFQSTQEFGNYQQLANQFVEKVFMEQSKLTCLIFRMLARKDPNKKRFEIFTTLVENHYQIWIDFKSEAFKMPDAGNHEHRMKFMKIHHFYAIKILFPEFLDLLFPEYNGSEWWDHNLILCGLMSKKDGQFYFLNKEFCAFFIADFLDKNFISSDLIRKFPDKGGRKHKTPSIINPDNPKIEMLLNIFINQEFKLIRIFLNDIIRFSTFGKIKHNLQKFIDGFEKMDNFWEFFTNDLEDLAEFVITILKQGNYKIVKTILFKNTAAIMTHANNPKTFLKFQDFLFEFLKTDDLKILIIKKNLIQNVVKSEINVILLEDFTTKVQQKLVIKL